MFSKSKIVYSQWIGLIIGWIGVTLFVAWAFRTHVEFLFDVGESREVIENNILIQYMTSGWQYLEAGLFGVFFGTAFYFIHFLTDKQNLRRLSFGKIILIRSFLYAISIFVSFFFIAGVFRLFDLLPTNDSLFDYFQWMNFEYWFMIICYFTFCIFATNVIMLVLRKFGPGNFFSLITGKYYKPREEIKVFLFIDLQSSTTIAESLGHKKYSQMIRDCFHDLTDIVIKYRAEVYQYVGDEVVLCWDVRKGVANLNCIKALIDFRKIFENKKEKYLKKYGVVPNFKGGIDVGKVTATEIGDIKRDIAYHGDVLNTASRIQEQCNKYNASLLISEHLYILIKDKNTFIHKLIGQLELRGKKEKLNIYSVS